LFGRNPGAILRFSSRLPQLRWRGSECRKTPYTARRTSCANDSEDPQG
jgi:hypothetical protein